MAQLEVFKGDITKLDVDGIVNAANTSLLGGGGVDGAIHRAAGKQLLEECRRLCGCKTGDAKITQGYLLSANYVIHTVGPVWHGGSGNEAKLLRGCYERSLELAVENNIKSIAFPCISTGIYDYPKMEAAQIAVNTVKRFVEDSESIERVIFVCFSKEDYEIYNSLMKTVSN